MQCRHWLLSVAVAFGCQAMPTTAASKENGDSHVAQQTGRQPIVDESITDRSESDPSQTPSFDQTPSMPKNVPQRGKTAWSSLILGRLREIDKTPFRDELEAGQIQKYADLGHAHAQFVLGCMHAEGLGVPQNDVEAVRWFQRAAEQDFAVAQNWLGSMYQQGRGIRRDDVQAFRWFHRAAQQGLSDAQFNLAICYRRGTGTPQDDFGAVHFLKLAAEQDHRWAQFDLGWMCYERRGGAGNDVDSVNWYRRAAVAGLDSAQYNLGYMYDVGLGVEQDFVEASSCRADAY